MEEGMLERRTEERETPRSISEKVEAVQIVSVEEAQTEKEKMGYKPIRRSDKNRDRIAYDPEIGAVNFDSNEPEMIARAFDYAQKYKGDYEKWFPDKVKVVEETPRVESAGELEVKVEAVGEPVGEEEVVSSSEVEKEIKYCHGKKCGAGIKGRGLPPESKYCGTCGGDDLSTEKVRLSRKEFKEMKMAIENGVEARKKELCIGEKSVTGFRGLSYTLREYSEEGEKEIALMNKKAYSDIRNLKERTEPGALGIVARDLGNVVKEAGRAAFKTVTYPIVGNLSANLKKRLEGLVGKQNFDANQATRVSTITNMVPYFTAFGLGCDYSIMSNHLNTSSGGSPLMPMLSVLGIALVAEGIGRNVAISDNKIPYASIPGKIVSLPLDGLTYVLDRARDYVGSVKKRTKAT